MKNEWIKTSECLPDDGRTVLVFFPGRPVKNMGVIAEASYGGGRWHYWHDDGLWIEISEQEGNIITHWMEIPDGPYGKITGMKMWHENECEWK